MLFIHTWEKVLSGEKTLTSRLMQTIDGNPVPCRYKVGKTYAVQKEWMGKAVGRILVLEVYAAACGKWTTAEEAKAEGFASTWDFAEKYEEMHGKKAMLPCWRIKFKLVS